MVVSFFIIPVKKKCFFVDFGIDLSNKYCIQDLPFKKQKQRLFSRNIFVKKI